MRVPREVCRSHRDDPRISRSRPPGQLLRFSGLALGLPSTTAFVLFCCGCERGSGPAIVMANASLLGLVATVALPLVYAWAVAFSWRLPRALAASVTAYVGIAVALGCLPPFGAVPRLGVAIFALACAARSSRAIPASLPAYRPRIVPLSTTRKIVLRTALPVLYMVFLSIAEHLAGSYWAGLGSTFPTMSLVVLLVTHLEAGPDEACRIAQVLPVGNLSTLAFLAAFGFVSGEIGLAGGMLAGYAAALGALVAIEASARPQRTQWSPVAIRRRRQPQIAAWRSAAATGPRGGRSRACAGRPCPGGRSNSRPPASKSPRPLFAACRDVGLVTARSSGPAEQTAQAGRRVGSDGSDGSDRSVGSIAAAGVVCHLISGHQDVSILHRDAAIGGLRRPPGCA